MAPNHLTLYLIGTAYSSLSRKPRKMNGKLCPAVLLQSSMGNMAAGSCLTIFWAFLWVTIAHGEKDFPLIMPRVHPASEESYICTPIRLSDTQTFYVNRFTPNASAHTAHHMLVSLNFLRQELTSLDQFEQVCTDSNKIRPIWICLD